MSKIGNYSRYTTSFKIAVKLGIADPAHVKALPRYERLTDVRDFLKETDVNLVVAQRDVALFQ